MTRWAGQAGLLESFTGLFEVLLAETQSEIVALSFYRPRYWEARVKEWADLETSLNQVRAIGPLSDLPLVVLSGEPDLERVPPDFPADEVRKTARALQVEVAQLSTNNIHIVCDTCGHYIPLTDPERVVEAIRQVVEK